MCVCVWGVESYAQPPPRGRMPGFSIPLNHAPQGELSEGHVCTPAYGRAKGRPRQWTEASSSPQCLCCLPRRKPRARERRVLQFPQPQQR